MDDDEFDEFLNSAMDLLLEKQEALKLEYGIGTFTRWHFDQATETLSFFDAADKLALEAEVIDIGSYAPDSSTWKWAWSNDSILPSLREKAAPLRELQTVTGISLFGKENAFSIDDENMAWELAAMGMRTLGAMGVYRAPSSTGALTSFLAIMRVRRAQ